MENKELATLRQQINDIDAELLDILATRQALTAKVAKFKIESNKPVRDKAREEKLLQKLIVDGKKIGLDPSFVTRLFHLIIENSVLQQQSLLEQNANPELNRQKVRLAFLGEKGSYSYLAGKKYFSRRHQECDEVGCNSFADVIKHVEDGNADYAVLPLENSTSGSINEVYDQLQQTQLHIVGEITEEVEHSLLVHTDIEHAAIETLYAHPQIFAQCSHLLAELGQVEVKPCDSTSAAMKKVKALKSPTSAAIGPQQGGQFYGLKPLPSTLTEQGKNHSRFIVVAKEQISVPLQVPAKTAVIMSVVQTPGALVDALLVLKEHKIAMTKLESRPTPGNPWEEMFYVDMQGNIDDGPMRTAIDQLRAMTKYFKVLGCYPVETVAPTRVATAALVTEK